MHFAEGYVFHFERLSSPGSGYAPTDCRFEKKREKKAAFLEKNRNIQDIFIGRPIEKGKMLASVFHSFPLPRSLPLQLSVSRPIQRFSNVPTDMPVEKDMKFPRARLSFLRFVIIERGKGDRSLRVNRGIDF